MASWFSKDEIIAKSFTRKISIERLPDSLIESVQYTHIKPVLRKDFFDAVNASPSSYTDLLEQILPALSYFVKYYMLPEIWNDISASGINKLQGSNRQTSSSEDFGQVRQATLEIANMHLNTLTEYLYENSSSYPLYYHSANPVNRVKTYGGIVFPGTKNDLTGDDDPYAPI